jgi:hypothetical protein
MKREIAALAAVLVLAVGGYYGYDAYLGKLPKTTRNVRLIWYSLDDPRAKSFNWTVPSKGCKFLKVKALGLAGPVNGEKGIHQKLELLDALGQEFFVNERGENGHNTWVQGDGHRFDVTYVDSYHYLGNGYDQDFRNEEGNSAIRFEDRLKNGTVKFVDRNNRRVLLQMASLGERIPMNTPSYACFHTYTPEPEVVVDGEITDHVRYLTHYIHGYLQPVEEVPYSAQTDPGKVSN